ncbi:toll/interleukin-1 receptor domain-containing protein (plasmid) [Leptospira sp. WS60.C2]
MPLSQNDLLLNSLSYYKSLNERVELNKTKYFKKKSAFLCHSHKDEALVKGLIVCLKDNGIDLYVDWLDQTLPNSPNVFTAQKIQRRILECDLFLFLATQNSMNSRWCPWEIGYADASVRDVLIIPTSTTNETYGNEYLELYESIDLKYLENKYNLTVYNPNSNYEILLIEKIKQI